MGEKNPRLAYRLLIAAGWLGAHRFYLHRYASAVAQLLLTALMVALWIWGGPFARWAPYLIGPILLWLIRDGFWLFDYFRVEEEMDTSLAAFVDSDSPAPKSAGSAVSKAADAQARSLVEEAASADDADARKKTRAIKLAKQQIALSLQENHPQAALTAVERLVKYLQQRSRRPQHDAHLAEAYLLHGMVLYQTQYLDAARKKLQMGVHLASSFAHLSVQTEQAKNWLEKLRNPQLKAAPGSPWRLRSAWASLSRCRRMACSCCRWRSKARPAQLAKAPCPARCSARRSSAWATGLTALAITAKPTSITARRWHWLPPSKPALRNCAGCCSACQLARTWRAIAAFCAMSENLALCA